MKVRVFASLRQTAGTDHLDLDGTTVRELLDDAANRYGPDLAAQLPHCSVAVNGATLGLDELDTPVDESDEVAFLPPVAGGDR